MSADALLEPRVAEEARAEPRASGDRVRALVTDHFSFVWRSLVRLGVPRAEADDALQQVFLVASRKIDHIEPGMERSFLFGTALRIASRAHRGRSRRREVPMSADAAEPIDPAPGPDETLDRERAKSRLHAILDEMPLDLRAVFVLYELEQLTAPEIAASVGVPLGTVASRLRRARDAFRAAIARREARISHEGTRR